MSEKKQKKVLGRGLDALLGDSDNTGFSTDKKNNTDSLQLSLDKIYVNPNQPRTNFDSNQIDNLVVSIKELGTTDILNPIPEITKIALNKSTGEEPNEFASK